MHVTYISGTKKVHWEKKHVMSGILRNRDEYRGIAE